MNGHNSLIGTDVIRKGFSFMTEIPGQEMEIPEKAIDEQRGVNVQWPEVGG